MGRLTGIIVLFALLFAVPVAAAQPAQPVDNATPIIILNPTTGIPIILGADSSHPAMPVGNSIPVIILNPDTGVPTIPSSGSGSQTPWASNINAAGYNLTGLGHVLFTDNTYDIGATGATRPRTGYFGTSLISPLFNGLAITNNGTNTLNIAAGQTLTVSSGGTLGTAAYTPTGDYATSAQGTTADSAMPKAGGTFTGNVLFTDATYDIGASGATRPRTGYFGTSLVAPTINATTGFTVNGVPLALSDLATTANQLSSPVCAVDAVGTDSYAITLSPSIAAYQTNALYCFKAGTLNTGASSLAVNGLAATPIKVTRGALTTDTVTGDILANQWVIVRYNGTNMMVESPVANPQRFYNAGSLATGVQIWDDLGVTNYGGIYWSASLGLQFNCAPAGVENDCSYIRKLNTGKAWGASDRNGTTIFSITEGVAAATVHFNLGSDATGDTYYRDASGNFVRLGIGGANTVLHGGTIPAYSALALADLPTTVKTRGISFTIGDPAGSALTAAATTTDYVTVPFACTISAWNLLVDAGTITVKFWKVATGTAIPTSAASINTSGVAISSGTAIHSTTLTDFTSVAVTANDILAVNVTAVATAKYLNAVLECVQ